MSTSIRFLVGFSLAAAVTGCHALDKPYVDPKVAAQVLVTKSEPPPGCALVGAVRGSTLIGDLGDAHGDVLRNAVLRGGNFVTVDLVERPVLIGVGGGYTVRGRLFACPSATRPEAVASAPPAPAALPKACDPDCANGFTCQLGTCVASPVPQAAAR